MAFLYPYQAGKEVPSYIETDKIEPHGYFQEYLKIAADIGPFGDVCEVGVYEGESLRMWQGLFPLGKITGVDCNPNAIWPQGTAKVVMNQDDPGLAEFGPFDLVVEDASHNGVNSKKTFDILWPQVKPGGYYVIEDWYVGFIGLVPTQYEPEMLSTVASLLELLKARDSECDSVLFRYGMAIVHRAAAS
jgi:predicted O-methyltransferase YrrM